MKDLMKNKTILETVGAVAILLLLYFLFLRSPEKEPSTTPTGSAPEALGADLLKMSNDLSRATLSQELFSNPGYLSLSDFSTPLPLQPVGRTNPFDVIGRE